MKVVLFCGGKGLRMREASRRIPKPMVQIGGRPVLWHVMKYFSHFGNDEFILTLGHKADVIKDYFLDYREATSNDFVLSGGGAEVTLLSEDISSWTISFIDTGYSAKVGERLRRVREHIGGDDYFLANYGDVLTDAPLDKMVDELQRTDKVAAFMTVPPAYTFHLVEADEEHVVQRVRSVPEADLWINGGYFVFRSDIFDYLNEGDELVTDCFNKLILEGKLLAFPYRGFWAPMDTLKEQQELEAMVENGGGPWRLWSRSQADASPASGAS